jgi:hypothetical protein
LAWALGPCGFGALAFVERVTMCCLVFDEVPVGVGWFWRLEIGVKCKRGKHVLFVQFSRSSFNFTFCVFSSFLNCRDEKGIFSLFNERLGWFA